MTDPIKLIGNVASPYTRKMVAYLRYKRIPYEVIWGQPEDILISMNIEAPKPILLPVFILNRDGRATAVTDSTPLIREFEEKYPDHLSDEQMARELFVDTKTLKAWVRKGDVSPDTMQSLKMETSRFLELRDKFSVKDEYGNVLSSKFHKAEWKPLVKILEKMTHSVKWIVPVVKTLKRLEVDNMEDNNIPDIEFQNKELDDLVILRSDESPTYHFCNVIDDNYQNVTHIIRGEDHLPNTPKQIQIVNALGYEGFEYAHLPLVLGEDRKRLSKRHAATDLMSYRQEGYLPEAILNMLAKLGWSNTTEDIFDLQKLTEIFEVQDIQKAGAVFDIERLNFVNQAHVANMKIDSLKQELDTFNKKNGFSLDDHHDGEYLLELCKGSANNLSEISSFIKPFLLDFDDYNSEDFDKHLKNSEAVIDYFKSNLKKTFYL